MEGEDKMIILPEPKLHQEEVFRITALIEGMTKTECEKFKQMFGIEAENVPKILVEEYIHEMRGIKMKQNTIYAVTCNGKRVTNFYESRAKAQEVCERYSQLEENNKKLKHEVSAYLFYK